MNEISKFESYKKKLQGICDEHDLVFRLRTDKYPFTLTIKPAAGLDQQMSMLENVEEQGYTSPDAYIRFTMKDGALTYRMDKSFTIGDALFAKIKNLFKNLYATWLEFFFRDVMERGLLKGRQMPVIDENEDDLPEGADPFETTEDDEDEGGEDAGDEDADGEDEDDDPAEDEEFAEDDPEVVEATQLVRSVNKASVSFLQRQMKIGYGKATRLMDALEKFGVVGPYNGSAPREVLPYDAPEDGADTTEEDGGDNAEA